MHCRVRANLRRQGILALVALGICMPSELEDLNNLVALCISRDREPDVRPGGLALVLDVLPLGDDPDGLMQLHQIIQRPREQAMDVFERRSARLMEHARHSREIQGLKRILDR